MDPGFLLRNNKVVLLNEAGGTPLGMFEDAKYDSKEIQLEPGDRIVLFTDGVYDQRNEDGESFTYNKLKELVEEIVNRPASDTKCENKKEERFIDSIMNEIYKFSKDSDQTDDMTMEVIHHTH